MTPRATALAGVPMPSPLVALGFTTAIPPMPTNGGEDGPRIAETALRHRMLTGRWQPDLMVRRESAVGTKRNQAWSKYPDLSSNLFAHSARTRSTLYDLPPSVTPRGATTEPGQEDPGAEAFLGAGGVLAQSGWAPLMARVQYLTVGLRECLLRIDASADGQTAQVALTWQIVTPEFIVAQADPNRPDRMEALAWLRLRIDPRTKEHVWTYDVYSIKDPKNPFYKVVPAAEPKPTMAGAPVEDDLSGIFLGGSFEGEDYPYRWADGRPFLPWTLAHAQKGSTLFDPWAEIELVSGTLTSGVNFNLLQSANVSASFPQRWVINAQPVGGMTPQGSSGAERGTVVADPMTVLMLKTTEEGVQPMVGQWLAGADVGMLATAFTDYEVRVVANHGGVKGGEILRTAGDSRSGIAMAVSRSAEREMNMAAIPQFKPFDEEGLGKAARIYNLALVRAQAADSSIRGIAAPEEGFTVHYSMRPPDASELDSQRNHQLELLREGLTDRVSVYRALNPGTSESDALDALRRAARINALTNPLTAPTAPPIA